MSSPDTPIQKGTLPSIPAANLGLTSWTLSLTVALFVLGLFLSIQWRSEMGKPAAQDTRTGEIYGTTVRRLEEEQRQLKSNVERLQKEVQGYQEYAGQRQNTMGEVTDELRLQRIAAGLVPLQGPGVKVVLDDSKKTPAPGENPNLYIIHDYQLRDVVSLLWHAGGETIAINTERLVGTTSIYSSGGTVMVNSTRLSPPFVVCAGRPRRDDGMGDPALIPAYPEGPSRGLRPGPYVSEGERTEGAGLPWVLFPQVP